MKEIKKEDGIFYMELEENEDPTSRFYSRKDLIEVHLPVGLKTISEEAFILWI